MAYEIKMNDPALPKGAVVTIDGLGNLTNGETTVVSNDQHEAFRAHNSTQKFAHDKDGNILVTTENGPTLAQAFKDNKSFTVKEVKSDVNPTLTTDPVVQETQEATAPKDGE